MLSSGDKIVIKTCGNLKDFLPEAWTKTICNQNQKDEHWTIFCRTCAQPVRSIALQEAFGHGHPELQSTNRISAVEETVKVKS